MPSRPHPSELRRQHDPLDPAVVMVGDDDQRPLGGDAFEVFPGDADGQPERFERGVGERQRPLGHQGHRPVVNPADGGQTRNTV